MHLWGNIHLIRSDWNGPDDEIDEAVVETFEKMQGMFDVACELWELAGNTERARTLRQLVDDTYGREPHILDDAQIGKLVALLDGVEDALVGTVVDRDWNVRREQLPDLRRRTQHLDLAEERGELAVAGVGEAIGNVGSLRNILRRAFDRGLWILLG